MHSDVGMRDRRGPVVNHRDGERCGNRYERLVLHVRLPCVRVLDRQLLLLCAVVAVQLTTVWPSGKKSPLLLVQVMVTGGIPPVDVAAAKVTTAPARPGSFGTVLSGRVVIVNGGVIHDTTLSVEVDACELVTGRRHQFR